MHLNFFPLPFEVSLLIFLNFIFLNVSIIYEYKFFNGIPVLFCSKFFLMLMKMSQTKTQQRLLMTFLDLLFLYDLNFCMRSQFLYELHFWQGKAN